MKQFSDFCGRHGRHYTSQAFVPCWPSVRNYLIWQQRKSPVEARDRESGMVHARLSESNLCRAGAPPAAKIWGTDAVAYANANANDKRFPFCLPPRSVFSIRRPMLDVRRFR